MANTFLTPDVIAARALATLYNNTVLLPLIYRDYEPDFNGKQGDTISVRKPALFTALDYDRGSGITVQNAQEGSFPVSLDTLADVSFAVTAEDLLLEIGDFATQLLNPAMEAHAQKVDADIAAALLAAATAGGPTVPVTIATTDIVTATGHLFRDGDRVWFPTITGGGAGLTALTPYYVINSVPKVSFKVSATKGGAAVDVTTAYTGGTVAEAGNATVTLGAGKGAPEALVDARTKLTNNLLPASQRYTAISPDQAGALLKDPLFAQVNTSGSTDALIEASIGRKYGLDNYETQAYAGITQGVAFHQQAVAFVSRTLPIPMGKTAQQASISQYKGLGLRVVYDYDIDQKQDVVSIDMLSGLRSLRPAGAVKMNMTAS